jgi:hypothetical protein
VPCTCIPVDKKKPSVRKKLESTPQVLVQLPEEPKSTPRAALSGLIANAQQHIEEDLESERDALTALFKVFDLEQVGDPGGLEAVRPKLKMSPVDIDIIRWKRKRERWLRSRTT